MASQSSSTSRMHRAAALYYEIQPNAVQQELCTLFQILDLNGDGRITEAELKSVFDSPSLFALLDKDGNGELDFEECKCLFFLAKQQIEICDGRRKNLLEGVLYVCVECNVFHLCPNCYGARNNLRPVHPHSNLLLRPPLITGLINEIIDRDQRRTVVQLRSVSQPIVVSQPPPKSPSSTHRAATAVQTASAVINVASAAIGASAFVASGCSIM
ncbi:hypothetical protein KP509_14G041600 [Ceratopteris richardii]|uniref:EF-hand domain-containing protein n=1 Tax=Ceratopteris richardii TaxID=49495 RepID=A0A8T2TB91_CERRI|nr:hypothetical protein KP509_14G041600 [Ceratopteris richardii]